MSTRRILFMGTAELACESLAALCAHPAFQVVAAVTQPDRPRGRNLLPQPPPVKVLAQREGLPVLQPERARAASFLHELQDYAPDLIVVAAYGQILPQTLLDLPRHGCLNVHASLLPQYRGAAPIQWALLNGESETGVTIMQMDAGLDTGPILAQRTTPIEPGDDAQTLHNRLAALGATLLLDTIPGYLAGQIRPRPQPAQNASYARKITREDGHMDWHKPAETLHRQVRALTPWPGSYTRLPGGPKPVLLKIWSATIEPHHRGAPGEVLHAGKSGIVVACGENALRLLDVQREGGRRLPAGAFLAGHPLSPGQRLG
ncbi:MAG: methionyl-tRNA formyltransferase [Verrucomicrobia bacterium]|nr:methionyl-tRNA formyltransferase [Verrucomicrobiota bacterium]